ncbi:unnamed protein product [Mytilus coruscus]|uniref:Myb/SANT-like DNA-binding domain-containing protein n=1 Tax=Mytilus coruscus TaxID=42192 RepID=A0A6J8AH91_MYTCO|nr:unnamed protein product [Mytilus coruscus]
MATGRSKIVKIRIVGPNKTYEGNITPELASMINAPDCDPELKKVIYQAIIRSSGNEDPFDTVGESQAVEPESQGIEPESQGIEPESPAVEHENPAVEQFSDQHRVVSDSIHNWTEKEEKLLIAIRGDMEETFNGTKQHDTLWGKVVKKMNQEGVNVSIKQVINKWKNLKKKKYKEVIDSNNHTDNNRCTWKHFDAFNRLYGNKASTVPCVIVDTSKKSGNVVVEKFSTADIEAPSTSSDYKSSSTKTGKESVKRMKKETKCKSDRISTIITEIQDTNNNVVNLMKEQHGDRIKRMDRLLDILEKSIDEE